MNYKNILLLVLFSFVLIPTIYACSCIQETLCEQAQRADSILQVTIKSAKTTPNGLTTIYTARPTSQNKVKGGRKVFLKTGSNSAMCGLTLEVGKTYLLGATRIEKFKKGRRTFSVGLCGLFANEESIESVQSTLANCPTSNDEQNGSAPCILAPCSGDDQPICGSDGITYPNQCEFDYASCSKNVKSVFLAPCKPECDQACLDVYEPVCGTDGITYSNECYLSVTSCYTGVQIDVASQGKCPCNQVCTEEFAPVCGSDGVTYSNPCNLDLASCNADYSIYFLYDGECRNCSTVCTQEYAPVCGSDGMTYPNQCSLESYSCISGIQITVASDGECPKPDCSNMACPAIYQPVCGSDGITYSSSCDLEIASCQTSGMLFLLYDGECRNCNTICTEEYTPVCGSDGITYSNECFLQSNACIMGVEITVASSGECPNIEPTMISVDPVDPVDPACEQTCPLLFAPAPVCGTDGVTYASLCDLENAVCKDGSLSLAHEGDCVTVANVI